MASTARQRNSRAIGLVVAFTLAAIGVVFAQGVARDPGLYATIETSMGTFVVQLYEDKAPKTVDNFVGLAKGTKEWTDPATGAKVQRPFYDGLTFFNVTPHLAVTTGCPKNDGTGGPGYTINDEVNAGLKFDRPGRVAMYTTKPNTGGSQFMITVRPALFMNGKFTIFGQVTEGLDVVERIARTPVDADGHPTEPITIHKVTIDRVK